MRSAWKLLLASALIILATASPAAGSVPKVIFADEFGYPT